MKNISVIITTIMVLIGMITFIIIPKSDFSEGENRVLQSFPDVNIKNITEGKFTKELSEYLSDHFPIRNSFINIKTSFEKNILKKKLINNIYVCDDGYFIENYKKPENTDRIINTFNKFAENTNVKPDLILVPTAITIYDDKLPEFAYPYSQLNEIDKIYSNTNTNNIDIYDILNSEKGKKELFYRLDHHWTTDGAYLGYKAFCDAKGINPLPESEFNIETVSDDFKGTIYSKLNDFSLNGDVIKSYNKDLNLTITYDDKKSDSLYAPEYLVEKDKYSYFLNNINTLIEITNNDVDTDKELVIAKDSYANCMIPFLVNHYKKIYVFDPRSYKGSISEFANSHKNVSDILILYNMNTIDNDTGVNVIY